MRKHNINRISKVTAAIILIALAFVFVDSEFGQSGWYKNNTKDNYCKIVINTNIHLKTLNDNLPKLEHKRDICIHCFEEIESQTTQTCFERTNHLKILKQSTEVYLFNQVFLI